MLILVAIMLIGFMVTVAFSVDIAHMHLAKTELRTATDAASKAAAATLSETFSEQAAIERGQQIAALNLVNGERLLLAPEDFRFGRSMEKTSGRQESSQSPSSSCKSTPESSSSASSPLESSMPASSARTSLPVVSGS